MSAQQQQLVKEKETEALAQARNLALLYARAHTRGSYMSCDSKHGNLIIPVVPVPEKETLSDREGEVSFVRPQN